jgi:predicted nucleotidyltransferase component of viral defense system
VLDLSQVRLIAQALGTHPSLVEKDWHVVRALKIIAAVSDSDVQPVFSGGTSLAKGWGLINRFSEDIDFKAIVAAPSASAARKLRSTWRGKLITALSSAGFTLENEPLVGNASQFVRASFNYRPIEPVFGSLRPALKVEVTFRPPHLAATRRPIQSFINQAARREPEVSDLPCVDPVETAADKISALAWRTAIRDRASKDDDPTIVRHIHDLAALVETAGKDAQIVDLARTILTKDAVRAGSTNADGVELLRRMLPTITDDPVWRTEYEQFVQSMAFGPDAERIEFDEAIAKCEHLVERVLQGL